MKIKHNILNFLKKNQSKKRINHSIAVAILAEQLSLKYEYDPEKAYLAGLAHDIAREIQIDKMIKIAKNDGDPIQFWEKEYPILLHGRAGAVILKRQFGVNDINILSAICDHIYGRPNMEILSKIIYVADFFEPNRLHGKYSDQEKILNRPIDSLVLLSTKSLFAYLIKKGKSILPPTLQMVELLKKEVNQYEKEK